MIRYRRNFKYYASEAILEITVLLLAYHSRCHFVGFYQPVDLKQLVEGSGLWRRRVAGVVIA